MSGISKSKVPKSTTQPSLGPQFGGLNSKLAEAGKRFDPALDSVRREPETNIHPSKDMGGAAGGPSLLDSMAAMGANPATCTLSQVIAFLSFVCPSLSARAIQLEWTKEQIIAAMHTTRAPKHSEETDSDSHNSGSRGEPPVSDNTPTSTSTPTRSPAQVMPSHFGEQQLEGLISRDGGSAGLSARISGNVQPQASVQQESTPKNTISAPLSTKTAGENTPVSPTDNTATDSGSGDDTDEEMFSGSQDPAAEFTSSPAALEALLPCPGTVQAAERST